MDRLIGENLVAMRGEMSQKALADAMRDKGHKWSQSTVWAVEKGDRPLKLTEAHDLEDLLGVAVSTEWFRHEPAITAVSRGVNNLTVLRNKAIDALTEYFWHQVTMSRVLRDAWGTLPNERERLAGFVAHAVGFASTGPEWMVEEARAHAEGSQTQVIGGVPGEAYPHRAEILQMIRGHESAIAQLLQEAEVVAHVQKRSVKHAEEQDDGEHPEA